MGDHGGSCGLIYPVHARLNTEGVKTDGSTRTVSAVLVTAFVMR